MYDYTIMPINVLQKSDAATFSGHGVEWILYLCFG